MKKLMMATAALALTAGTAFAGSHAKEVKLGVLIGFTGPIESLTAAMAAGLGNGDGRGHQIRPAA